MQRRAREPVNTFLGDKVELTRVSKNGGCFSCPDEGMDHRDRGQIMYRPETQRHQDRTLRI